MRGDGHTAYGGNSPCIEAAVEAYPNELTLPPAGTVAGRIVPFDSPVAQQQARALAPPAKQSPLEGDPRHR